jgi:hypothetical protein
MGRAFSTHGENRNACRVLVGKPERKREQGRSRSTWEDNIKCILENYNGVVSGSR